MGLFDKLRNELIDIIEWKDDTRDTIVWRFPRYQSEIKNGAQLTVRESQVAVLVDEGKFADVFQPGRHELTTANIPILSTIRGWKYGFNSPFKVDVYFVNTKEFLNMRWGTTNPVTVTDPQLHRAINLRAFGSYNFRVSGDPTVFLRKVAGTNGTFDTEAISEMLRTFAVTEFSDYLGEHEIPVVKMASNYKEFSAELTEALKESFKDYGLELTKFLVENISLPPEVQAAIDRGASMAFIGAECLYADAVCQLDGERGRNAQRRCRSRHRCHGHGHGFCHGSADGSADGSAAATADAAAGSRRAAATAPADDILRGTERTAARTVRHGPAAADGHAGTAENRHARLDAGHGRMGRRRHRAGTVGNLCPDAAAASACTTGELIKDDHGTECSGK